MQLFIICPTCGDWDSADNIDPACAVCGGERYVPLAVGASLVKFSMPVVDPGHPGGEFTLDVEKGKHGLWYGKSADVRGLLVTAVHPAEMGKKAVAAAAELRAARLTIINEVAHGHEDEPPQEAA